MNCNLYGVGGSFDLRVKNRTTEVGGMFMGAHSPRSGDGLFLRWTRLLQRLFSRLPTHFLHLGFKLGGFFCRLFKLFYRMPRLFPKLPSSFYKLLRLVPKVLKFFPRLFRCFHNLHVLFLKHPKMPRLYPRLLRLFHKLHRFFGTIVAHAFSYASWGF